MTQMNPMALCLLQTLRSKARNPYPFPRERSSVRAIAVAESTGLQPLQAQPPHVRDVGGPRSGRRAVGSGRVS